MDENFNPMKTIGCNKVKELTDGFSKDLLASEPDPVIDAHLAHCPACSQNYRETQEILSLLDRDRLPEPKPEFWDGLSGQIMAQIGRSRHDPRRAPWFKKIWGTPFGWPGYAWATALILILLTPLAIYTMHDRSQITPQTQGVIGNELRWELGFETLPSTFESLSEGESARLGKKIVAQLGNDLSGQLPVGGEEELQWDVSPNLEGLNSKELDFLIKKLQTGDTAGFNEVKNYVS
jgi:hypothetical protein